ncbi:hypothetical protein CAPTEDRAFT_174511 [Capitella teleta]|uniref:RING-type E3 ubiquitin transferase n=1 Tax=Capitella teleta TaxID=283909 RepID=R7V0A9_CAPTE|nr:hypothetical protein CAPTEDRAFT_174511 [Capitella teleta]|eukprot:ELU12268.1 hypothetical protein CAPTEDRAFT_174511 [Capitella teleta]
MSAYVAAKQAEIIRSHQKDDFYTGGIQSALSEIVQTSFGPRIWINWRHEIDLLADLGYFVLTTVSGYQTLGEEYVNILQVNSSHRVIPSRMRRVAMVLLQILTPYLLHRILNWLETEMRQNRALNITPRGRDSAISLIKGIRSSLTFLHRCHLAVFYMSGVFYHFSKRFTGIHYLLVRPGMQNSKRPSYKVLGWLSVIQLSFSVLQQAIKALQETRKASKTENASSVGSVSKVSVPETSMDPQRKCALCLETRQNSTATPCGHLFCWDCIVEWCTMKPQCPLCRETSELSRLIILKNFDQN